MCVCVCVCVSVCKCVFDCGSKCEEDKRTGKRFLVRKKARTEHLKTKNETRQKKELYYIFTL